MVCLMVGQVVEREAAKFSSGNDNSHVPTVNPNVSNSNPLDGLVVQMESNLTITDEEAQRIGIAVSLSLMVGIIQVPFVPTYFMIVTKAVKLEKRQKLIKRITFATAWQSSFIRENDVFKSYYIRDHRAALKVGGLTSDSKWGGGTENAL